METISDIKPNHNTITYHNICNICHNFQHYSNRGYSREIRKHLQEKHQNHDSKLAFITNIINSKNKNVIINWHLDTDGIFNRTEDCQNKLKEILPTITNSRRIANIYVNKKHNQPNHVAFHYIKSFHDNLPELAALNYYIAGALQLPYINDLDDNDTSYVIISEEHLDNLSFQLQEMGILNKSTHLILIHI